MDNLKILITSNKFKYLPRVEECILGIECLEQVIVAPIVLCWILISAKI